MDRRLCQGLCNVPTEQKTRTPQPNPTLQNNDWTTRPSLSNYRHGSHHGTTDKCRIRCHSYNRRPWMHPSSGIPPLQDDHHRGTSGPTILRTHLSLVWVTIKDDFGSRPTIHVQLRPSTMHEIRSATKYLFSIPSANRRPIRKQKPMGRIVPKTSHFCTTRRLGSMATDSDGYPQPLLKRNHQGSPERGTVRIPSPLRLPLPSIDERPSRRTIRNSLPKADAGTYSDQSLGRFPASESIQDWRQSLARRQEPETALSITETCAQTPRSIPYQTHDLQCSSTIGTASGLDHS